MSSAIDKKLNRFTKKPETPKKESDEDPIAKLLNMQIQQPTAQRFLRDPCGKPC